MEESIRQVLALNVRLLRSEKLLTQETLAELSGLHRTYVGAIERCERNITLTSLDNLAHALGVNGATLLTIPMEFISREHTREA